MKIKRLQIKNFKRFSHLTIEGLSEDVKLVLLVGPNGGGKSSLLEAFNTWYKTFCHSHGSEETYTKKYSNQAFQPHQDINVEFHLDDQNLAKHKKTMYFRTAYRNDPDFMINSLNRVGTPYESLSIDKMIQNDQTVSANYQRLISYTLSGVYEETDDTKTIKHLREELIGQIRASMQNVFHDLVLNNFGDPLSDGSFRFQKGNVASYHYKNLSGGEKSAFDLLLDLILKVRYYDNTVFFIDEPETHIHTSVQGKLVEEMLNVIPENSQLWLTTHSLGVMRSAQKIAKEFPEKVAILDFSDYDFDDEIVVTPSRLDKIVWEKFLSIALDDFAELIAPKTIILCEGSLSGRKRKDFDASIYNKIFASKYADVTFVSGGNSIDLQKDDHIGFQILQNILSGSSIFKLIDKDDKSETEVEEARQDGVLILNQRHLECYLFADEVLQKLVFLKDASKTDEVLLAKQRAINNSVSRGNPIDDIKSASGEIVTELKKILSLTQCGNTTDTFMRDTLASLVTEDMNTYQELEKCIFG